MTVRQLIIALAVLCLVFWAFGWLTNDTVSWLGLGLAFWCLSFGVEKDVTLRRRR